MSSLCPDVVFQVQILKKLIGNHLQCIFRPGLKPVYGAAVDQGWKHPQTVAETFPDRTHGYQTNMNTVVMFKTILCKIFCNQSVDLFSKNSLLYQEQYEGWL